MHLNFKFFCSRYIKRWIEPLVFTAPSLLDKDTVQYTVYQLQNHKHGKRERKRVPSAADSQMGKIRTFGDSGQLSFRDPLSDELRWAFRERFERGPTLFLMISKLQIQEL